MKKSVHKSSVKTCIKMDIASIRIILGRCVNKLLPVSLYVVVEQKKEEENNDYFAIL